jgi:hypothetical protein
MNCPFCSRPLDISNNFYRDSNDPNHNLRTFSCQEQSCWVFGEFPRYLGTLMDDVITQQEYALENKLYVKVYQNSSVIYEMVNYMLVGEIRIPRSLWLNPINIPETLDKIKMLITFS